MVVRVAEVLLEPRVLASKASSTLGKSIEIDSGEDSIVRNHMVLPVRLEVVVMLEGCHILKTKEESNERVSIIDSIKLLSSKVLEDVSLNNWLLSHGSILRSGSWSIDTRSESEDVFVPLVLESVRVHIYES